MRSSREDTERHRREIVDASARLFREKGVDGVSVPALMEAVGMTHGGFYKHFASKEQLVPETYQKAFGDTAAKISDAGVGQDGGNAAAWNALVDYYLSPEHRDDIGTGCPAAAFAGDAARAENGSLAQTAYEAGLGRMLGRVEALHGGAAAHEDALADLSTLIGALLLSRATSGALSEAFLSAAKAHLHKMDEQPAGA